MGKRKETLSSTAPKFDVIELQKQFEVHDRQRFTGLLADLVAQGPSQAALTRFRETNPGGFYKAVLDAQAAAGMPKQVDVNVRGHLDVRHMSYSQLEDELRRMGIDPARIIEASVIEPELVQEESPPERSEAVSEATSETNE